MAEAAIESGGFLPPSLPSPAPSNASSTNLSGLPHPRSRPLRAGSSKEEAARRYVEAKLLNITRRYAKKHQPPEPDDVHGYQNMSEVCKDLNEVIDVLWLSGTPSLQIPSLLNVALSINTYLSAFAPSPISTFALLKKLDHAFASLLKGEDVDTGEILPGFETGKRAGMSKTDMVRLKSLVEATRVQIVEIMSNGDDFEEESNYQEPVADDSGIETDGAMSVDVEIAWDEGDDGHNMDVARVYAGTIMQLGTILSSDTSYDPVAS